MYESARERERGQYLPFDMCGEMKEGINILCLGLFFCDWCDVMLICKVLISCLKNS